WETGSHASFMTNGQPIPAPSVYLLALDSSMWMDAGAWSTNGAAVKVSLGQYAGYPWAVCYSQWTNGQQGRVYAASIAAPAFDGARLSALRFLYRAFNTADNITVTIADAGSTNAFSTNTLTVTYTDSIHELVVPNLNRAAASGFTLQATVKVTAETADGSWTALPRVEALWSK
ncbi:MAG: hypothetical protein ACOYOU_16350, partial [Kiritimatiellia bacterium]